MIAAGQLHNEPPPYSKNPPPLDRGESLLRSAFLREKFNFSGHEDLPSVDHGREVFDVREVAVFSYINKHIFTVILGYQISGATLWPGKKKQIALRSIPTW